MINFIAVALENKVAAGIIGAATSATGLHFILRILNRIDLEKRWFPFLKDAGRKVSAAGNSKFTHAVYEPYETFLENFITGSLTAFFGGADEDDAQAVLPINSEDVAEIKPLLPTEGQTDEKATQ